MGHDGLDPVRALLPGVRLQSGGRLGGNERTHVERIRARHPDGTEASYIAKLHRSAGEGWVREAAALSLLPPEVRAPRVVAEGRGDPPVLVIEDLGDCASVADALVGDDPGAADAALQAWATALAALHVATRGSREAFRAALASRQGDLPVPDSRVPIELDLTVRALDRACSMLRVQVPAGALDELRGLTKRLGGSGLAALTPADACPDNNLRLDGGVALVDFEGAQWRHLAWDLAYLHVPWPTCWCCWRMPDAVVQHAVEAYLRAAAADIPEVAGEAFDKDVEAAVVGWALMSTMSFLDNALGADPPLNPGHPTPTRRAMILHRLARAAGSSELPTLAGLSAALHDQLHARWGDVPLAFAPAFRAAQ